MALSLGLRQAECVGLRCGAVDLEVADDVADASLEDWTPIGCHGGRRGAVASILQAHASARPTGSSPAVAVGTGDIPVALPAASRRQPPRPSPLELRLDRHDSDPGRPWSGLLQALAATGRFPAGSHLHELRSAADQVDPSFVDTALRETATVVEPVWMVLDDVHVLRHPTALASLELLLRRAPSNLHLVLSGRTEPPIGDPPAPRTADRPRATSREHELAEASRPTSISAPGRHGRDGLLPAAMRRVQGEIDRSEVPWRTVGVEPRRNALADCWRGRSA